MRIAPNWRRFVHAFYLCNLPIGLQGRFEVFVSALENCVSRRRELALVETRFECWVSATESQASHAALTIRVLVVLGTAPPLRRCGIRPAGLICLRAGRARPRPFVSKPPAPTMAAATQSRLFRPPLIFKCSCRCVSVPAPAAIVVGGNHMSQVLEWRELLESAHKQLQDAMTNLITNKNYSEAERRLHAVDQLMVDLIEDMGGNVIRSGLWT